MLKGHTVTDGDLVDYAKDVPLLYACGTTPVNAMLVSELLAACETTDSIIRRQLVHTAAGSGGGGGGSGGARATASGGATARASAAAGSNGDADLTIVALCGGSGAELIGICSYINTVMHSNMAGKGSGNDSGEATLTPLTPVVKVVRCRHFVRGGAGG